MSYQVEINAATAFAPGTTTLTNTAILNADQAAAATTTTVTVTNHVPIITSLNVSGMVDENGDVALTGTFSDASTVDTHTVTIVWNDGNSDTINLVAGERSFSITHPYLDDDPTATASDNYPITVTVTDAVGFQDVADASTVVKNVAPAFAATGAGPDETLGAAAAGAFSLRSNRVH